MNVIAEIKKTELEPDFPEMEEISASLDKLSPKLPINIINWIRYSYKPEVSASVEYSNHEIFIKYYVSEKYFKAEMTETNQRVFEDSCVEFFVSPEGDGIYYNLEFNAIGTCLMGSGTSRENSTLVRPEIVSKIRRLTSMGNSPVNEKTGGISWTITLAIPFEVLFHHSIRDLKGKTFRANFYKCGDKLTQPHYLTWNPVDTEKPDFHQPSYFGLLRFL
jgi:hypothetical protein